MLIVRNKRHAEIYDNTTRSYSRSSRDIGERNN